MIMINPRWITSSIVISRLCSPRNQLLRRTCSEVLENATQVRLDYTARDVGIRHHPSSSE
jgi:hypothetical protein